MIFLLKLIQKAIIATGLILRLIAYFNLPEMRQDPKQQLIAFIIVLIFILPPFFLIQFKIEKEERTRFMK